MSYGISVYGIGFDTLFPSLFLEIKTAIGEHANHQNCNLLGIILKLIL